MGKTLTMNPEVKQKWIDALRSGEYTQHTGEMTEFVVVFDDDGYETDETVSSKNCCCLGVLCDIYANEHDTTLDKVLVENETTELPANVMDWSGFYSRGVMEQLAEFNDGVEMHQQPFEFIAWFIEEQL